MGVPQRSILGQILFDIFKNDIRNRNANVGITLFVDDTTPTVARNDLSNLRNKLEDT